MTNPDSNNPLAAIGNALTKRAVEVGSVGQFKGFAASSMGSFLMSVTPALPETWELWVQWPCFLLIVLGMARIAVSLLK